MRPSVDFGSVQSLRKTSSQCESYPANDRCVHCSLIIYIYQRPVLFLVERMFSHWGTMASFRDENCSSDCFNWLFFTYVTYVDKTYYVLFIDYSNLPGLGWAYRKAIDEAVWTVFYVTAPTCGLGSVLGVKTIEINKRAWLNRWMKKEYYLQLIVVIILTYVVYF